MTEMTKIIFDRLVSRFAIEFADPNRSRKLLAAVTASDGSGFDCTGSDWPVVQSLLISAIRARIDKFNILQSK